VKFEIVDKAEEGAGAFGVKVISSFSNDYGTWKSFNRSTDSDPGVTGRNCQCECGNGMRRIIGIA
jgi:hypothetical protein